MKKKCARCFSLENIIRELHWMARRYTDDRSSYATSLFNDCTRVALNNGVKLKTPDNTIWACDDMGRRFDGLSDAEATPGTPEALGK